MDKKKRTFYTEAAYLIGLAAIALGTAFMTTADFGVSMIVAPAYLVHLKLSQTWSFVTFGVAEYILQFTLLVLLIIVVRRFRWSYLFSFVTALLYGMMLDVFLFLFAAVPSEGIVIRLVLYVLGLLVCAAGVSLMFHTYISPEVYELFVKEVTSRYGISLSVFKTIYDCLSCVAAIIMSFVFFGFGEFEGVRLGTVVCALVNGWLIGRFNVFFEEHWIFQDKYRLRTYF